MAPKSWRPDSSVGDCVTEQDAAQHIQQSGQHEYALYLESARSINDDISRELHEFSQSSDIPSPIATQPTSVDYFDRLEYNMMRVY